MKNILTSLFFILILSNTYGQKNELRVSLDSGLFSFSGGSAEKTSSINAFSSDTGYTNNPYGAKNGLCYGISLNYKRVTKGNFVFGAGLGYENVSSKVAINAVNEQLISSGINRVDATGKTTLDMNTINVNPFFGYRFNAEKLPIDLVAGFDFASILNSKECGDATDTNGMKYTTSVDRKTISTETRPRIQISTDYKKFGIYLGYSFGLNNYKEGYVGGVNEAYSKIFRFGLTYRVL
ncbi:MAG: hypothetical protein EOO44_12460 [Flavobacterium sp.]|nr:MAG: hypothetical protein EOO44_12460 [Flavobacterium sp.]